MGKRGRSHAGRHCTSLIGQSFSALRASSLENVTAVCGLHSLSEAMLLFSLSLLRLVSSEHYLHLLIIVYRKRVAFVAFTLLHNDTQYYILFLPICQEIFENSPRFR